MLKKFYISALAFFMSFVCCINAKAESSYNWHFKAEKNGEQPILLSGNSLINHPALLCVGSPDEKTVYLTFDAGYSTENVEKILSVLKEEDVKAAFFILPAIYKYAPHVAKQMIDDGHLICNHTTTHKNVSNLSFSEFEKEIRHVESEFEKYTGHKMEKFFRPPEGAFSENTLEYCEKLGYKCVFWSFAYADWDNNAQKDKAWAKEKILSNIHNGEVMLLHPNSKTNADILKDVIKELKKQGYTFGSLNELSKYKESR